MSTPEFINFSSQVNQNLAKMEKRGLYCVELDRDELWQTYLGAFPEGTNPIHIARPVHDCSCCRHFIKQLGNVVTITDGQVRSLWNLQDLPYPYDVVAQALDEFVLKHAVDLPLRRSHGKYGEKQNRELVAIATGQIGGGVRTHNHFWYNISAPHLCREPDSELGTIRTAVAVFKSSLDNLDLASIQTVIDLIKSNALYRGNEFLGLITSFQKHKIAYSKLNSDTARQIYILNQITSAEVAKQNVFGFKNTVIGTLVEALSKSQDLEHAVASFESKVAPQNYRRTSALVTPRMIENAMKTIQDMGIEPSLARRFASLVDLDPTKFIWHKNVPEDPNANAGLQGLLMQSASKKADASNIAGENITMKDFINNVVPRSQRISVFVENQMQNRLMALTTAVDASAPGIFNWPNHLGWSYRGNYTDAIQEKVKREGGRLEGKLRASLSWYNTDDLDLSVEAHGFQIYYGNRRVSGNKISGALDVDMNVRAESTDPVENIYLDVAADGIYRVYVKMFSKRNNTNTGFAVQIADGNTVYNYEYSGILSGKILIAEVNFKDNMIKSITPHTSVKSSSQGISNNIWGIETNSWADVHTVLTSPNHWHGDHGNLHWFFLLDNCVSPEQVRGIYNEFLRRDLQEHRKVIDLVGEKTQCSVVPDQACGLGFSSTMPTSVLFKTQTEGKPRYYRVQI